MMSALARAGGALQAAGILEKVVRTRHPVIAGDLGSEAGTVMGAAL
jgi:hypothetical protein